MASSHSTAARNAIAAAVVALLDQPSAGPNATGSIVFLAGATPLCSCNFSNPSFNAPVSGSATSAPISPGTVTTQGIATAAQLQDRSGTAQIFALVGVSGSDINISNVQLQVDDIVEVSSLIYSAPP